MRRYLPWLICFLILRGLAYILITPPWQAPDETTHFQFMELLTHRSLSEIRKIEQKTADEDYIELERRILESMKKHDAWKNKNISTPDPLPKRFREATFYSTSPPKIYRPPLYYLLGAGLLRLFDSQDLETRLYIARLYSLILTLTTVIVSYFIGTLAFQNEREALMTGVFVSFLPLCAGDRKKRGCPAADSHIAFDELCGTSGFRSNFFLLWICCGRVRTGKVPVSRPSSLCRSIHIRD